jgi:hypothetical protein
MKPRPPPPLNPIACILAELDANIKFRENPFSQREYVSIVSNKKQKETSVIMRH